MSMASVALRPVQKDSITTTSFCSGQRSYLINESILIYLTFGGSVIPIPILESDSVASVKLKIQNHNGFFVKNQMLVYDGRELARNDSCVRDYGVTNGTVLHLVLRLSHIQYITARTVCGKEFEFHIERSRNEGYLKQLIAEKGNGLFCLRDRDLICDGEELQDQCQVKNYVKNNDAKSAKVRTEPIVKDCKVLEQLNINPKIELPLVISQLISSTCCGLHKGNQPVRSSEGCGGAYLMLDPGGEVYISVFKPVDEEPMAVNNPQGLPESKDGEGLKKGTHMGGGALREVAAYILDHPRTDPCSLYHSEVGFAGVPPTALVKCLHDGFYHPNGFTGSPKNMKIGSLQMYMKNSGSCEDMGPGAFPLREVHKISVLDIRLVNADRHAGNILVSQDHEGQITLIPIDHGYCLPSKFEDCSFDWLYWPHACQPYSHETIKYIESLDA